MEKHFLSQGPSHSFTRLQRGSMVLIPSIVPLHIAEFLRYCALGINNAAKELGSKKSFAIGLPNQLNFMPLDSFRIVLQLEHTIVAPGGRDSENAIASHLPITQSQTDSNYLVRICELDEISKADFIIEYSNANIKHVMQSAYYPYYADKVVYISPLLVRSDNAPNARPRVDIITMHGTGSDEDRRNIFGDRAANLGIEIRNINGTWRKYERVLDKASILVNIHQTNHHHTLEELRVVPSLVRKVVVISELVPRIEEFCLANYVVWTTYDHLIDTVLEIRGNYTKVWNDLFADRSFDQKIETLVSKNEEAFLKIVNASNI